MPRRNGTGPMGQGAMTGRGLGYCTEANAGLYGSEMGRGLGLGYGFRRGFGGFYAAQLSGMTDKEILTTEKELLTKERELLQKRLDIINKQLDDQPESEK